MPDLLGLLLIIIIAAVVAHGAPNTWRLRHAWGPVTNIGVAIFMLMVLTSLYAGASSPFLYFQF